MKKLILLCVVVLMALLLIISAAGCERASNPSPAPGPPAPRPAPPPPLEVNVSPEEAYYPSGQTVKVELSLNNMSSEETVNLDQWPPEIQVTPRLNYEQVLFSVVAGTEPIEISPKDAITLEFTWEQEDKEGRQVSPGWYNIRFKDIDARQGDHRYGFNPGARVLIQYPQGAVEKTIELEQSQTVNDITVTLERIELNSSGMTVYAFNNPPGYNLPPGQTTPAPLMWIQADAEYSIDGGAVKKQVHLESAFWTMA